VPSRWFSFLPNQQVDCDRVGEPRILGPRIPAIATLVFQSAPLSSGLASIIKIWVITKKKKKFVVFEQKERLLVSTCSRPPIHEARSIHTQDKSRSSAEYRMYWYTVCQHPFYSKVCEIKHEGLRERMQSRVPFLGKKSDLRMGITIYNILQDVFTCKIVDFWF
jgi:hypothetical protein